MDDLQKFKKIREKEIILEGCGINEHDWSCWFCSPQGLTRQCRKCGKTESGHMYDGKLIINAPLLENGFLDKEKLKGEEFIKSGYNPLTCQEIH